jgi:hypothetical protein
MGLGLAWLAKYILIPLRDQVIENMKDQTEFRKLIIIDSGENVKTQQENVKTYQETLKRLSDIFRVSQEISAKIRCPTSEPRGSAHHA